MPLYDAPEHTVTFASPSTSHDGGGGTAITYTLQFEDVPCSLNVTRSVVRDEFGQEQLTIEGTLSALSSTPGIDQIARGWKVIDTTANSTGGSGLVVGISRGPAYGTIPPLTYVQIAGKQ
jgi:hypothetical protein